MLVEMQSSAFKIKEDQDDGAMSIGKSSTLLAIDFVFGGDTYIKSDGVQQEGDHAINFAFEFDEEKYYFCRSTKEADKIFVCDENYIFINTWTKAEYTNWLKERYQLDFPGLSFRIALSSYFRVYGKKNHDELNPLQGIPGQNMEKSITAIVTLFNRYGEVEEFKNKVAEHKSRLDTYKQARKYHFISDLVGGNKKYEENLVVIRSLENQLATLMDDAEKGHTEEDIEKNKKKAALTTARLNIESEIQAKERKLHLVEMSLEYGLYPTEADLSALQEYFPSVNLKKLYDVERYHQKLAKILDSQFSMEREAIQSEIAVLQEQLRQIRQQISDLGFVGNLSREFLDKHSELKSEIDELRTQNQAYLTLKELQKEKARADEILKKSIADIFSDIESEINFVTKEINDCLFKT